MGVSWAKVQKKLWESVSAIKVVEVNSQSADSLDYATNAKEGLNVIAVGGFSLSRGLTLEGLMVSYFLRNSMMYDTLLQMGRWFGYRIGYEDLCRVWMPAEAAGWYAHIAESIEELRDELRRMQTANATPKEFGLRVRSHPDTLIVTARNKMGSGQRHTVSIGLGNRFVETAILCWDAGSVGQNHKAAINLAQSLASEGLASEKRDDAHRLFRGGPVSHVIDFLAAFRNHEGSMLTETDPILRYIRDRAGTELAEWDVCFPSLREHQGALVDESLGFVVHCQRRSHGKQSVLQETLYITDKQRVSSRGMEKMGLTEEQILAAETAYRDEKSFRPGDKVNYPDHCYRRVRERPLLIVHLLAIGGPGADLSGSKPVVAWSISFPQTAREDNKVEYVVNTTWFSKRFRDEDEDDLEGDDDG